MPPGDTSRESPTLLPETRRMPRPFLNFVSHLEVLCVVAPSGLAAQRRILTSMLAVTCGATRASPEMIHQPNDSTCSASPWKGERSEEWFQGIGADHVSSENHTPANRYHLVLLVAEDAHRKGGTAEQGVPTAKQQQGQVLQRGEPPKRPAKVAMKQVALLLRQR